MPRNPRLTAYIALAAVCLFWGTTYLAIRMALESFPPATLVFARFTISGSLLLGAAFMRRAYVPRGRELLIAAVCGVLILGIGNGALAYAEVLIPSGLASLFITLSPFWLVGIEAMLPGGERLHPPVIAGMGVGFAGVALLLAPGLGVERLTRNITEGFLMLQCGVIAWSGGSIWQRRQEVRAHPVVIGAVQQLAAGLVFAPVAAASGFGPIHWSVRGVCAAFYLVIFGSIVGYSAYAYALDRLPVAIVSVYPYVNAVVAVSLGWLFYREAFGWREAAAMGVIFAGVALVKWHTRHARRGRATVTPRPDAEREMAGR